MSERAARRSNKVLPIRPALMQITSIAGELLGRRPVFAQRRLVAALLFHAQQRKAVMPLEANRLHRRSFQARLARDEIDHAAHAIDLCA